MRKILVVDDEQDIVYLLRLILEKEGYEVVEANSGTEGLEVAKKEKPDLILLDVMMPDMSGWGVCRKLKELKELQKVPIAMLTVKSEAGDKIKSLDAAKADWHIAKPVDKDKLIDTVSWLLKSPPKRA